MLVDIEGEENDQALLYTLKNKEHPTETNGVAATKVGSCLLVISLVG